MISSLPQRRNDWGRGVRSEADCHAPVVNVMGLPSLSRLRSRLTFGTNAAVLVYLLFF